MAGPVPPEAVDPGLWSKIATAFGGVLTAVVTWMWNHTHGLIKEKADKESTELAIADLKREQERSRNTQIAIYERIEEESSKTEIRFATSETKANDRHIELLKAIHAIDKG